ncbi:MAG: dihydropteroate synthase [Dehalococcoidia bacterium]|nr:dihydropteroate synthase [Dehalococcoidia bacterium]
MAKQSHTDQRQVLLTHIGGIPFHWGSRTHVMGVVNVTPDSFSGDGVGDDVASAVGLALRMQEEGADLVDVGAESTRRYNDREGAVPVGVDEELRRVLPVVERLCRELSVPVSVDTYKPQVARRCLEAGAHMINDVWGVRTDTGMSEVVAEFGVPVVLMHNRDGNVYSDLLAEVTGSLGAAVERALASGVPRENVIVDPGIGFGKVADQSLEIEGRLAELGRLGQPVLVGPSRKSHLGMVLGGLPAGERLEGTAAAVSLCVAGGADIVRVHDVKEMVRVVRVSDAIVRGWRPDVWSR